MHEVLLDAIRHNNWATKSLISFCRDQNFTAEQLEVTGVGTYGDPGNSGPHRAV
jgi:hypothetical protein